MSKKLFGYQKNKANEKDNHRPPTVMVFFKTMIQGNAADNKSQNNHSYFKTDVMNNIDTKKWQATQKQGQQSTMNRTGYRSANAQSIPIWFYFHERANLTKKATLLQKKNRAGCTFAY